MSILRAILFCGGLLVLATPPGLAQKTPPNETPLENCTPYGAQGPIVEYQCISRNIERKEWRMKIALSNAIQAVREHEEVASMQDNRRNHVYLEWSQAEWRDFAEQNCTVIAGLSGGSSAWVTRYWIDCYVKELDRRIRFLKSIADGSFTAP